MQIKSLTEHENILLARNLFVGFIFFFFLQILYRHSNDCKSPGNNNNNTN